MENKNTNSVGGLTDSDMYSEPRRPWNEVIATGAPADISGLTDERIDAMTAEHHADRLCTTGSLRRLCRAIEREVLATKAAEVPAQTAAQVPSVGSIDTPEFRSLLWSFQKDPCSNFTIDSLIAHIDSHIARLERDLAHALSAAKHEAAFADEWRQKALASQVQAAPMVADPNAEVSGVSYPTTYSDLARISHNTLFTRWVGDRSETKITPRESFIAARQIPFAAPAPTTAQAAPAVPSSAEVRDAALELEQSMPDHGYSQKTLGREAMDRINSNWPD